jgi:hypothetical protein
LPFARWTQWRSFCVRSSPPLCLAVWTECSTWTCTWPFTPWSDSWICFSIALTSKSVPSKLFSKTLLELSTAWLVVSRIGFTMKTPTATMMPTATARRIIPDVRFPKSC